MNGGYGLYMDYYYLILVLPALLLAMVAQWSVQSTVRKYSQVSNREGMTGADAARLILSKNGIDDVNVTSVSGTLTDHYDPSSKTVRLSDGVFASRSLAAVAIAAHETGHAIQHARGYKPLVLRSLCYPVANIGSSLGMPMAIFGLMFSISFLVQLGIVLFALAVFFYLITLPVEINASTRAIACIREENILAPEELGGAKKVLTAAAMTYVASAAVAIANLLRLILLANNRRRD